MSLSVGYDIGLKSLLAAQSALQTIGNNIANANTPGFSREQVILGATAPVNVGGLSLGTGVTVAFVKRIVDDSLERRLLLQRSSQARIGVETNGLQQLENIVNGAGGNGLPSGLSDVFTKIAALASHPDDKAGRQSVFTSSNDLANSLRELASQLSNFRTDSRIDASMRVDQANSITSQIANINGQISNAKASGTDPHGLLDQRQQLLNSLTQITEATTSQDNSGMIRVLVGGHTVVSGTKSFDLVLDTNTNAEPVLRVKGSVGSIAVGNGAVAGLLNLSEQTTSGLQSKADSFAKAFILAFNRVHSTGMPATGGFEALQGVGAPAAGAAGITSALSAAGYDVDIQKGDLYINVQDTKTGEMVKTKIAVDPSKSLQDFAAQISGISHLSATIDASGTLRMSADSGYRFDFSSRLDTNPDQSGAFGGAAGAVTGANTGPFALTNGDILQVTVDGGVPKSIVFSSGQFADITKATADEVAAAINGQLTGGTAVVDHGMITILSNTTGDASSIQIADGSGSPNSQFGFSTAIDTGSATASNVKISGSYNGAGNDAWTFRADADGQIGVTPNLTAGVYDSKGNRIATLSIGEGYAPGTKLAVKDGVEVSFAPGVISNTANDTFSLDVVAKSDSSDVLSALGLNTFFSGNSAANIGVRQDLADHPELLSSSLTGAPADAGNLNRLLAVEKQDQSALNGETLPGFLTEMTSDLALDTKRTSDLRASQDTLVGDLSNQREQVSGVSLEEEMANMVQFQQAFGAAGRYIQVLQDATSSLMNLIR